MFFVGKTLGQRLSHFGGRAECNLITAQAIDIQKIAANAIKQTVSNSFFSHICRYP